MWKNRSRRLWHTNKDFPGLRTWSAHLRSRRDGHQERWQPQVPDMGLSRLSVIHTVIVSVRNHFLNQRGAGKRLNCYELISIEIDPDPPVGQIVAVAQTSQPPSCHLLIPDPAAILQCLALPPEATHPGISPVVASESFSVQLRVGRLSGPPLPHIA